MASVTGTTQKVVKPEEEQKSTFRENISTNWQNRKVVIISSALLTVAGAVGLGLAIAFSGGTAAIAIAGVAAGVGLIGTVGSTFIPPRSAQIDSSRAEVITPQVTEPISGQARVEDREVEATHDELEVDDPEKAKREKAAKKHKDANHATQTPPLARDEVAIERERAQDLPPLSDPEAVRSQDLPPYIRSQHARTQPDLRPSVSPRTSSVVDRHFKALTGKDFDPINTQGNSYRAYRILEDVARGNKESLVPSLQRFAAKWPKSFGRLLNAATQLARETGHTDLIPLIEAQRTAPQPLVTPSGQLVTPSVPTSFAEELPQAFDIEEDAKKSSGWGKYLGLGMFVAAAAGAAYAYVNGINPLTYFQGTTPPVVTPDPVTPETPVTPDTSTVVNNGTSPAPQFSFPEHRPEVIVSPKTASTLFEGSPVLNEVCPAPGYNVSSTPSGTPFFTPIRVETPVTVEEVVSPVNVESPQGETQVPKFSVPPEVVTDTRTCAAPEITVDNPFASIFGNETYPVSHTPGSTTPQGVVTPGMDYRPPETFFGAGKVSEEHTDLVLPQGTKPSSFTPAPFSQKEFTCIAPPTSSGMDFGAFSQRKSPALPVSLPFVPADPTTSGVCAATTPVFAQPLSLPVTLRLDSTQVALPSSQNVPFSPSPQTLGQHGEVSPALLETTPITTPLVSPDAGAVAVYGQKTSGTPVDVNPVYTKEQLDFILRSGRQMPASTTQSGVPFIFEHSGSPTGIEVVPFEAPQESTSGTTFAAPAPSYEEFCHPTSDNGTFPANFNYEARDAFCDVCSPTTSEGLASPEFLRQRDAACEQAFSDHGIFLKGPVFTQDQATGSDVVLSGSRMPHAEGTPQIEGSTTQVPTFSQKFYDFFMGRRSTFGTGQFVPTMDAKPPVITNGKGQFLIAPSTDTAQSVVPTPENVEVIIPSSTASQSSLGLQQPAVIKPTPQVVPSTDVTPLTTPFSPALTPASGATTPVTPVVPKVDVTPLPTPFNPALTPTPGATTPVTPVVPKVDITPLPTPFNPALTPTPGATTPVTPVVPKVDVTPLPTPFSPAMSPPDRAIVPNTPPVIPTDVTPLPTQFSPAMTPTQPFGPVVNPDLATGVKAPQVQLPLSLAPTPAFNPLTGTDTSPVDLPVQDGVCLDSARNAHTRFLGQFPAPVIGNQSTIAAPQVEYPLQPRFETPKLDASPARPYDEFCGTVSAGGVLPADVDPDKIDAFCNVCSPTTPGGLISSQFLSQRDAACKQAFTDHRVFLRDPIFTQGQTTGSEVVLSGSTAPQPQDTTTQMPTFGQEDYLDILMGRRSTFGTGQFAPTVDTKPPVITNGKGQFLIAPSTDTASGVVPNLESVETVPSFTTPQLSSGTTTPVTPVVPNADVKPLPTPFSPVLTSTPGVTTPAVQLKATPTTPLATQFSPAMTPAPKAIAPSARPLVVPRGNGFDFYWKKYDRNATKVLEGTMKSNPKYDDPEYLDSWDRWLSAFDYSSPSPAKGELQPASSNPTTRTDGFKTDPLPLERRDSVHEQNDATYPNDTLATGPAPFKTPEEQEVALMMPQIQTPGGTSSKFDSPIFQDRNGTFCPADEPRDTQPELAGTCPAKPTNGTDISELLRFEAPSQPLLTSSRFDSPQYQNKSGIHCPPEQLVDLPEPVKHPTSSRFDSPQYQNETGTHCASEKLFDLPEPVEYPTSSQFDSPKYQNVSGTLCPWEPPRPMFTPEEPAAPVVYPVCDSNSWEAWGHYAKDQAGRGVSATGRFIGRQASNVGGYLGRKAGDVGGYLKDKASEAADDAQEYLSDRAEEAQEYLEESWEGFKENVDERWEGFKADAADYADEKWEDFKEGAGDLASRSQEAIAAGIRDLASATGNLISQGFWKAVGAAKRLALSSGEENRRLDNVIQLPPAEPKGTDAPVQGQRLIEPPTNTSLPKPTEAVHRKDASFVPSRVENVSGNTQLTERPELNVDALFQRQSFLREVEKASKRAQFEALKESLYKGTTTPLLPAPSDAGTEPPPVHEPFGPVERPLTYPNASLVTNTAPLFTPRLFPEDPMLQEMTFVPPQAKPLNGSDTCPSGLPVLERQEPMLQDLPVVPTAKDEPNITVVEDEQARILDAAPEIIEEEESVPQEVTAKVVPKPEETTQSFTARHLDPEREASEVSRDCIRLGNQLSEKYRKPYSEFFHGKPKDAWDSSDAYTWGWGSKDKCYLPRAAWTESAARENREPMIAYCNCMMDLWNTRNPVVQAAVPALEVDERVQAEELPVHEVLEPVEVPQIYPNTSLVSGTAQFFTPNPVREDPVGMTFIPPREDKPLNGTTCPSGLEVTQPTIVPTKVEEPQVYPNMSFVPHTFDTARYFTSPRTDVCPLRDEQCDLIEETQTYPNMSFIPSAFDMTEHVAPRVELSPLRSDQCSLIKPAHLNETLAMSPAVFEKPEDEVMVPTPIVEPASLNVEEEQPRTVDTTSQEEPVIAPVPQDEPASITVAEEKPKTLIDTAPQERMVEEEPVSQQVPAKVAEKPKDTAQTGKTFTAQPIDPSQEASIVSQECRKLGRTLSDRYKAPYDEFFSGKPADAWDKWDYTNGWTSTAPCPMPAKAYSADAARKRKGPMVEFCNCMMDLWKTRHPTEVPATA